jgi:hypothetical protein
MGSLRRPVQIKNATRGRIRLQTATLKSTLPRRRPAAQRGVLPVWASLQQLLKDLQPSLGPALQMAKQRRQASRPAKQPRAASVTQRTTDSRSPQ